jgi:hypothetical protein
MGGGSRTAFDLVEVNDLEAVGLAWVIGRTVRRTHGGPQCQATDTPHTVDTDFHGNSLFMSASLEKLFIFASLDVSSMTKP